MKVDFVVKSNFSLLQGSDRPKVQGKGIQMMRARISNSKTRLNDVKILEPNVSRSSGLPEKQHSVIRLVHPDRQQDILF